jgi:energy-coupling factor transporter ATP-binding protein EcfA2
MRISNFAVRNQRAIRLAACDEVPRVMVITGPNGCGKSTLLNALRNVGTGPGRTLYVGPHRTSRRQRVQMRYLGQQRIEMSALLSSANLPTFDGINLPSRERDAFNFDEAQSFLKYSLCQIELDRQAAIAHRFDSVGSVSREEMPDMWVPLRAMTHNLLPHLQSHRIDIINRDQVQAFGGFTRKTSSSISMI